MRVLAAMSGGVDSTVAAARAVEAGHDVVGVHLALSTAPGALRTGSRGCCSREDAGDAQRAADVLGIPFYVWDFAERFREEVIEDFIDSYAAGETPVPGVDAEALVAGLRDRGHRQVDVVADADALATALAGEVRAGDQVICLGAGDITKWAAGLADDLFAHDGQITKAPVRALTLAALAPRPAELLWDLGAGSGSVSVEWCLAGGRAVAVETRHDRAANIRRNAAALRYVRFLFAGPAQAGVLHADPHPGNFRVLPDGRLGVVDFGLVERMPDGLPADMGRLLRACVDEDAAGMAEGLRRLGFISRDVDPGAVFDYLSPFVEPATAAEFHFTRDWMRGEFARLTTPEAQRVARRLNLPPAYLIIHRVWLGGIAVISQLDSRAPFGAVLDEFLPGYAPGPAA